MRNVTVVFALWISPIFTHAMVSGIEKPPWIDHDKIDWHRLLNFLRSFLEPFNSDDVTIRLADDTVDQTVIHHRNIGVIPGSINCKDFGHILLTKSENTHSEIVPIRSEWYEYQFIKDRSHAPPPLCLPIIITGECTDVLMFFRQIQLLFGVKAATDFLATLDIPNEELPEDYFQGKLPDSWRNELSMHFGIGYERECTFIPMVDIEPSWIT